MKIPNPQYFHQIRKGSTVTWEHSKLRVQEDRGHLYIVINKDGKRVKKTITKDMFFEAGTMADYVFNEWFHYYTPEEFMSYANAELNWLKDEL